MRRGSTRTYICPPDHKHGATETCYVHGCGCDDCRVQHTNRSRQRRKMIAYGRHQDIRVDKTEAAAHARALRNLGWTIDGIAQQAGVNSSAVDELLGERYRRTHRNTATAVLNLPLEAPPKTAWNRVPSLGSRRRVQALMFMGWSAALIEQRAGLGDRFVMKAVTQPFIEGATRDRIARVYDSLWNQTPPLDTPFQRGSYTRTVKLARERGWVGPLHWDDIDDPDDVPTNNVTRVNQFSKDRFDEAVVDAAVYGDKPRMTPPERREAVRILIERGYSNSEAAEVLGCTVRTVDRLRPRKEAA